MRKSYDGLLKRFPRDSLEAFLLAQRLGYTFKWISPRRIAGELSDSSGGSNTNVRAGRENFSRRDVEAAIALARRGQKLEPDNAFFDWALCKLLLIIWRDDEAKGVLARAAQKTRYDDHANDLKRITLKAHEIALGRALLWEEKTRVLSSSEASDYDYYGAPIDNFEREALFILAWKSVTAARRGDHAGALQWAEYAMRLAELQRKNSSFERRVNAAERELNLQNLLARDLLRKRGIVARRYRRAGNAVQTFQNYAAKHGRHDVAQLATRISKEAAATYAAATGSPQRRQLLFGFAPLPFFAISLSWLAGVLLLFSILGTLCGLVLHSVILCSRKLKTLLQWQNSKETPIARGEIIGGVLACSGLRAVLCAIAAAIGWSLCFLLGVLVAGEQDEIIRVISDLHRAVTAPGFWKEFRAFWPMFGTELGSSLNQLNELPFFFHFIAALLPLLLGVLYAQWRAVNRQRLQNGEGGEPRFWKFMRGAANGQFFGAGFDFDFSRAFLKLFDWLLFLACLAAWLLFAFISYDGGEDGDYWWLMFFAIALALTALVMLGNFIRWRRRPRRREAARYYFQLLRAVLWAWLLTASTLYFLVLLFSVPLRSQAEIRLERVLKYGEVNAAQMNDSP
jgi:hypothetical protein